MTKQHFIALADHLRGLDVPETVLVALIRFCKSQNPTFKEGRWRDYLNGNCGPNGGRTNVSGQTREGTMSDQKPATPPDLPEGKTNHAELEAAAPSLAAALKALIVEWDAIPGADPIPGQFKHETWEAARAALARAERVQNQKPASPPALPEGRTNHTELEAAGWEFPEVRAGRKGQVGYYRVNGEVRAMCRLSHQGYVELIAAG